MSWKIKRLIDMTLIVLLCVGFIFLPEKVMGDVIVPGVPLSIGLDNKEAPVTAILNIKNKELKVYGSGEMKANIGEQTLRWFYGYENAIKKISIEKGVKSIGDYAFGGDGQQYTKEKLSYVEKVSLPSTVEKIGRGAFYGARSLKAIEIPKSVQEIGSHAFNMANNLSKVTLHEGLKSIGNGAFMNCDNLKKIIIPDGITVISENVFYRNLQEITLPKTLKEIKAGAFQGQINATIYSVDTTIEEGAFPSGSIITCYKGSLTERSAIEKGDLNIEYIKEKSSVIKSPKPIVKVKRNKLIIKCSPVSNASGYQIRYSNNKNMKGAILVNKKSYISKKMKKGNTYYVQARAYDSIVNDRIKGKWSKVVKVKIK